MAARWLADAVVVVHLGFVAYVVLGGLTVLRWPAAAWLHLPAVAWGVWIEWSAGVCPLTPLEQWLRAQGGADPYARGFVEHYLLPLLYPAPLTRVHQVALGFVVLIINAAVYGSAWWRSRRPMQARRRRGRAPGG